MRHMILLGAHVALGVLTVATPAVGASEDVVRARQLLVEAAAMADRIDDDSIRAGLRRDIAGAQARAGDELAPWGSRPEATSARHSPR